MPRRKRKRRDVADELFSKFIRARDGACVRCGRTTVLQAAHCMKRRYYATRWDERNVHALCRACHMWETHRPLEGEVFWRGLIGDEVYDELRVQALTGGKVDVESVISWCRQRLKENE